MCVLSLKAPLRKKSGNLSYTPRNLNIDRYEKLIDKNGISNSEAYDKCSLPLTA